MKRCDCSTALVDGKCPTCDALRAPAKRARRSERATKERLQAAERADRMPAVHVPVIDEIRWSWRDEFHARAVAAGKKENPQGER